MELTAEIAREFLRYEPDTGKLFWRERDIKWFKGENRAAAWNSRFSNTEAFITITVKGYKRGSVFGKLYFAHRIIWLMLFGSWPTDQIDHINRVPSDNRIENLREADSKENGRNRKCSSTNKSGTIGVSWYKSSKTWQAQIKVDGRQIYLGRFEDLNAATKARKRAEVRFGWPINYKKD